MLTNWLTAITMYRLMLYYLIVVAFLAVVLSYASILPHDPIAILTEIMVILATALATNWGLAKFFKVSPNVESAYITALILSLIIGPVGLGVRLLYVMAISFIAIASKYFVVYKRRHIFNPAAFGVLIGSLLLGTGASWWVGNSALLIPVLIGGLIILKKIRRVELVVAFLITYFLGSVILFGGGANTLQTLVVNSPLLFFALVMLVEPQTSPGTFEKRIYFGVFIATILLVLEKYLLNITYGLELSLILGSIYNFALGQNRGNVLTLIKKQDLAPGITSFWLKPDKAMKFLAGQYLELSVPHPHPDSRGVRRFFTIASAPSEKEVMIASRFSPNGSSFKKALNEFPIGKTLPIYSIAGDFSLPAKPPKGYVFIAGGIGITPFRSIVKTMIENSDRTPATLFYSNRTKADIVFEDIFSQARGAIGLDTIYTVTDEKSKNWRGEYGPIDAKMIAKYVPNYKNGYIFYVSGAETMVEAFQKILRSMGVKRQNIKTDFFPGYPPSDGSLVKQPRKAYS